MRHADAVHGRPADDRNDEVDGGHLDGGHEGDLQVAETLIHDFCGNARGLHDGRHRDQGDLQQRLGGRHHILARDVRLRVAQLAESDEAA